MEVETNGQNVVNNITEKVEWTFAINTVEDNGIVGSTVQINTKRSIQDKHFKICYITILLAMKEDKEVCAAMKITNIDVLRKGKKKKVEKYCRVIRRTYDECPFKDTNENAVKNNWAFDNTEYLIDLLSELYGEGQLADYLSSPQWANLNLEKGTSRDSKKEGKKEKKGILKRIQRILSGMKGQFSKIFPCINCRVE
ncbi:Hypothetical predicted protein [Mytilus galloprovincialis]|uniref:Uncharacterized protein n=1 Tax=Mytilus galloprovincialis TaxID=29158 RepID=A0A8B6HTZ2_MYTGA|nr:Hypothetical predicted protein [Mytilus galloprovincialis]